MHKQTGMYCNARISTLLSSPSLCFSHLHVVAGHSLGGALSMLAAYDIKSAFSFQRLSVHTFGAPRPGNHAFAQYASCLSALFWKHIPWCGNLLHVLVTGLPSSSTILVAVDLTCNLGLIYIRLAPGTCFGDILSPDRFLQGVQ